MCLLHPQKVPSFFFNKHKHCCPLGNLITNVSWKEYWNKTGSRIKSKRNSLSEAKKPPKNKKLQNQNKQPQNKEYETRCVQIFYWTSTCSGVTSHFQDMHLILKLHFFLLRIPSSDQFRVKVWKQATVCCDTPSKTKQDKQVTLFSWKDRFSPGHFTPAEEPQTPSMQTHHTMQCKLHPFWATVP